MRCGVLSVFVWCFGVWCCVGWCVVFWIAFEISVWHLVGALSFGLSYGLLHLFGEMLRGLRV